MAEIEEEIDVSYKVSDMISGGYDLHVHTSPDIVDRLMDALELREEATKAGIKGILIKSHVFETASVSYIVNKAGSGTELFGSIALNYTVGGLNPYAVEAAVRLGAREVFLPTYSSKNHLLRYGKERKIFPYPLPKETDGLSIIDDRGSIKKEVYEITSIASSYGAIVGTGHIHPLESKRLIEEIGGKGDIKILITHPLSPIIQMPIDLLKDLAKRRNVWAEFTYLSCTPTLEPHISCEDTAKAIRLIGIENTILSTDLGQPYNISPVKGLALFVEKLMEAGVRREDLIRITHENPENLLGS